jgi:HlyD family secretion protein
MTATVTVKTHEAKSVVRIPNAALRYKPSPQTTPEGKPILTAPLPALPAGKGRIYLLTDTTPGAEKADPTVVDIGITDGVNTEVRPNSLRADTQVVIDETDAANPNKNKRKSMF